MVLRHAAEACRGRSDGIGRLSRAGDYTGLDVWNKVICSANSNDTRDPFGGVVYPVLVLREREKSCSPPLEESAGIETLTNSFLTKHCAIRGVQ